MPLVSICIPTYNRPKFLKEAIESCQSQTLSDLEIIVSDNSSNDESREYVEGLRDPRIRYFKNDGDIGGIRNIALAAQRARGKYIKVLMDDDLLKPRALERMVLAFQSHPTVGVVMAPLDIVDEQATTISRRFYWIQRKHLLYRYRQGDAIVHRDEVLREFLTRSYPCCVPSGLLYKRDCFDRLGNFDTSLHFAVDVDLCMRFATMYDFYYIDDALASWRYSPTSITVSLYQAGFYNEEFYQLARRYVEAPSVRALFPASEHAKLERDAYFFATKRCLLTIMAGLGRGSPRIVFSTLAVMWRHERYPTNFLKLPFDIAGEVFRALGSWFK